MNMSAWREVAAPSDIDELLERYGGFHDACIVSLNYVSGTYVDGENAMVFGSDDDFVLNMFFQRQWKPKELELCFTGVRRFHIAALQDNYSDDIFEAYLAFHDGILPAKYRAANRVIVWADDVNFCVNEVNTQLEEPDGSYVIATGLKWRISEE